MILVFHGVENVLLKINVIEMNYPNLVNANNRLQLKKKIILKVVNNQIPVKGMGIPTFVDPTGGEKSMDALCTISVTGRP
ncbi:hypothetical protein CK934_02845 [Chitinophaga sp. MD30]|nr:hypothetical protein CK934_02845 [Chitinophaga sp. MD30]